MKNKHIFFKFMKFSFAAHKPYFFWAMLDVIEKAGLTIFNAYSLSLLISFLETKTYENCLIGAIIIVLINMLFYLLDRILERVLDISKNKLLEAIDQNMVKKLMSVPFEYIEDPYYMDLKERAKFAIANQDAIYRFFDSILSIVQNILTLIGLCAIVVLFDYRIVIVLMSAMVLSILIVALSLKTQMKFYNELIPINRKFGYYLDSLLDGGKGKDFRLYSVGNKLEEKFDYFSELTVAYVKKYARKLGIISSLNSVVNYIELGLVYGLVAWKVIRERLSISNFSLYVSSAISFTKSAISLVNVAVTYFATISYLTPFVELMSLQEEKEQGKQIKLEKKIESIEFRDVSFAYPRSKEIILSHISFSIQKGDKISIVGLNGAGKTTLIKLLCRLYRPKSGDILVNGVSIYDYEYESYIKEISAVFQDYKLFAYSLKDNILNADGSDEEAYAEVCKVGLKEKVDALPQGIHSLYSKFYDLSGVELSGGEAQKLAIARALHKNASLVILDEPTSALDPLSEAEIYQNFNDLVKDKTAIYISHRMSSSVFCDKILIINHGEIENYDTHQNLMKDTNSLYYKLFTAQSKNYQN